MEEVFLGNGNNLTIKSSSIVTLHETFMVTDKKKSVQLQVTITADFSTIPEKYHEIFLNVLSSKYYNKASFGDNAFSQCRADDIKWWQFWKKQKVKL
jgi:hypothetical protein